MQQEFTLSTWFRIFYYLLSLVMLGFAIMIIALPRNNNSNAVLYFFPLLMAGGGILIAISAAKRKVVITNSSIASTNVFGTREIAINDIKGCSITNKQIVIESKSANTPNVIIRNYPDFNNSYEMVSYLKSNFEDLDALNIQDETNKLLQDTSLGFTPEERERKLANANKIAIIYTVVGVMTIIAAIFFDSINTTILLMIYPLLAIVIMATSNGLIKFISNKKRSVYPFVLVGFFVPAIILLATATRNSRIYSFDNLWLPVIALGIAVFALIYRTGINSAMSNTGGQIAVMLALAMIYSFGTMMQINYAFDKSPDKIYNARVIGHHISHGKSTSYYLYLSTWGPCHEQKQVGVGRNFYNDTNIGDTVKVDLKQGFLNAPWYVVSR
jgi:hypothetical protein